MVSSHQPSRAISALAQQHTIRLPYKGRGESDTVKKEEIGEQEEQKKERGDGTKTQLLKYMDGNISSLLCVF